ncbi:MAG: ComEC/Rec2 family competence protein [Candidatus Liptonbacteria bacterium]|nr:ComEC/Rec2 family competence protein [Candidatus Liptonbacteria bacterium]
MHKSDLAFGCALSLLSGSASVLLGWGVYAAGTIYLLALGLILAYTRSFRWRVCVLFGACFLAGILYTRGYLILAAPPPNIPLGRTVTITGQIQKEPRFTERSQVLDVSTQDPVVGNIRVIAPRSQELAYGDTVRGTGVLEAPQRAGDPPSVFWSKLELIGSGGGSGLKRWLLAVKSTSNASFRANLPIDSAALLAGITLGVQSDFSTQLKDQMKTSGTTHLVALSGYNIGILVLAIARVFSSRLRRRWVFWLTTAVIILFVIMVGASASVVRAAVMGFLVLLAGEVGRAYYARNAIVLTAAAMFVLDPLVLRDIGFQLSFVSFLGISYLVPHLGPCLGTEHGKGFLGWRANLAETLTAQLGVLPILLSYFGTVSLTGVLANVLILSVVPVTMFFGFLLAALSVLSPFLAMLAAWPAKLLLGYQLAVIGVAADLRLPLSLGSGGSWIFMFSYYAVLVLFLGWSEYRARLRKKTAEIS